MTAAGDEDDRALANIRLVRLEKAVLELNKQIEQSLDALTVLLAIAKDTTRRLEYLTEQLGIPRHRS